MSTTGNIAKQISGEKEFLIIDVSNNIGMKKPNNSNSFLKIYPYKNKTELYDERNFSLFSKIDKTTTKNKVYNYIIDSFNKILTDLKDTYLNSTSAGKETIIETLNKIYTSTLRNPIAITNSNNIYDDIKDSVENDSENYKNIFSLLTFFSIYKNERGGSLGVRDLDEVFLFLDQFHITKTIIRYSSNETSPVSYSQIRKLYDSGNITEKDTKLLLYRMFLTNNDSGENSFNDITEQLCQSYINVLNEMYSNSTTDKFISLDGLPDVKYKTTYSKNGTISANDNYKKIENYTSVKWKALIAEYKELATDVVVNGKSEDDLTTLKNKILNDSIDPSLNTNRIIYLPTSKKKSCHLSNDFIDSMKNVENKDQVLVEFCILNIFNLSSGTQLSYDASTYSNVKYKSFEPLRTDNKSITEIGNNGHLNYKKLLKYCISEADSYLTKIYEDIENVKKTKEARETQKSAYETYEIYQNYRLKKSALEKDFFYINNNHKNIKEIPDNYFVEIQFKCYEKEIADNNIKNLTEKWVYVTNRESTANKFSDTSLYSENYFSSFTMTDEAGVRKIELNLESVDDFNLETILLRSLRYQGISTDTENNIIDATNINSSRLANLNSSFRVRFGYKTTSTDVLKPKTFNDSSFIKRTTKSTPTVTTPWIGFKIIGLETNMIDKKNTFTVSGIENSGYIVDMLSMIIPSSSEYPKALSGESGTPENVIGTLASYLKTASNDKILILGDSENKIISGVNTENKNVYSYKTESINTGEDIRSDLNFDYFYNTSSETVQKIKDFTFYGEEDDEKIPTIRELLDKVIDYLPKRYYKIYKDSSDSVLKATNVTKEEYNSELKESNEFKGLKIESPKYNIIKKKCSVNGGLKEEKILIQFYFDGPYSSPDDRNLNDDVLRVYNYKNYNQSVIENINLESKLDFGMASSAVSILGGGNEIKFTPFSLNYKDGCKTSKAFGKKIDEPSLCLKDNYKYVDTGVDDETVSGNEATEDDYKLKSSEADLLFSSLSNFPYKGSITILGDPFYLFDNSMKPYDFEIYLNITKSKNIKMEELDKSFYSGIYNVGTIKHTMSSEGFTTELEIRKKTIG